LENLDATAEDLAKLLTGLGSLRDLIVFFVDRFYDMTALLPQTLDRFEVVNIAFVSDEKLEIIGNLSRLKDLTTLEELQENFTASSSLLKLLPAAARLENLIMH